MRDESLERREEKRLRLVQRDLKVRSEVKRSLGSLRS
jgi:hypothetical protein